MNFEPIGIQVNEERNPNQSICFGDFVGVGILDLILDICRISRYA